MPETPFTACCGIPMPYPWQDEHFRPLLYEIIDELVSLSGTLPFPLGDELGSAEVSIELLYEDKLPSKLRARLAAKFGADCFERCEIMQFAGRAALPERVEITEASGERRELDGAEARGVLECLLASRVRKRIGDLFIAANLACPGSLGSKNGFARVGFRSPDEHCDRIECDPFRDAVLFAENRGWPPLRRYPFSQVWDWLRSKEGFLYGFGYTPTTRALSAFSYLFDPNIGYGPEGLLWALVGIEAIYNKGGPSTTKQIKDGIEWLLGSNGSSTVNRGHEHHCATSALVALESRPLRLGGVQGGIGVWK